MIRIQQIKLRLAEEESLLKKKAAKRLHIKEEDILRLCIIKKSIDARKKPDIFYSYVIDIEIKREEKFLTSNHDPQILFHEEKKYVFTASGNTELKQRPVIIGMGPAGLFCAYMLSKHGYRPIVFEQGKRIEERTKDVQEFWSTGKLLHHSNVQFGEGGAGTFSDGKLNTLIKDKDGRNREVLRIFVENGAGEEILYDNKPHIGTDILIDTIKNMRNCILQWGGEIHFESKVTDFIISENRINAIQINGKEIVPVSDVVLAIGHSARETFDVLYHHNIPMESKAFAVGFRVQHPQELINSNQYGEENKQYHLPPASYKVTARTMSQRGVYSFCMCPGGYVVNASSESKRLAINGMSYHKRDSGVANSAIIVSVTPKDFQTDHPLGGMYFQRMLEEKAYKLQNGKIPIQYYGDFRGDGCRRTYIKEPFSPCIKGDYAFSDLRGILPSEMNQSFIEGMEHFGTIIPGFSDDFSIIAGIESRTSSPVRINRNLSFQSEVKGLYPCGEGAGYAGGITSAAMDGILIAQTIASKYKIR